MASPQGSSKMRDEEKVVTSYHERPVGLDTETGELPSGYFKSASFIGTMFAAQSAWAAGVGSFALAAPLLGTINQEIGPNPQIAWVALAYTLPLAVFQTLVGRLSDLFGRRYFFIFGTLLSLVGCIVCSTAKDVPSLIGGTVLLGVAAAAQLSVTYVVGELVPMKHRFLANAFVFVGVVPFVGIGPAISYAFVLRTSAGWRGCYYLIAAVNAFSLVCWVLFYFPPTFRMLHGTTSKRHVAKRFDYVGLVLFLGGFLILLLGISWGGVVYPWHSPNVIATIAVGGAAMVAFGLWEAFAKLEAPMIPIHLFQNGAWVALVFLCALSASVYYAFSIVWPQMVFGLYTDDLYYGGWLACLVGAGTNIGQMLSSLGRHIGKQKWQLVFSMIVSTATLGAAACVTTTNKNVVAGLMTVGCFFTGYLDSIGLAMVGICIQDQRDIGSAVGIAGTVRGGVATIATAIYSSILANELAKNIPAMVGPAAVESGLPESSVPAFLAGMSGAGDLTAVPGVNEAIVAAGRDAFNWATVHAYRMVFYSTIAFSVVSIVLAFLSPNVDKLMTEKVAATLHGGNLKGVKGEGEKE
ncbi:MFS general substrate transporter [Sodiomyces alkalinus F11]|uniref:MFS general substrate transporter n=1 Tax=Sodiomyces alkalinus (strain CBS 110278 / VKM F-3762 / F11) TaxID=1314773 RepID=A0A3N2PUX6_SODAK|nr:MFS general substrate transporter [Sodiomyces alkalinus F11]ROT38299.1 MFS general substrate transporter [Sodiomyces alkalinus F11]